eukprot:580045-Pleurochrysis_carterae.AAC.1
MASNHYNARRGFEQVSCEREARAMRVQPTLITRWRRFHQSRSDWRRAEGRCARWSAPQQRDDKSCASCRSRAHRVSVAINLHSVSRRAWFSRRPVARPSEGNEKRRGRGEEPDGARCCATRSSSTGAFRLQPRC